MKKTIDNMSIETREDAWPRFTTITRGPSYDQSTFRHMTEQELRDLQYLVNTAVRVLDGMDRKESLTA